MRIYLTMVMHGSKMSKVDTIMHGGGIWLVPMWLQAVDEGYMFPERIVRIDLVPHQAVDTHGVQFLVNEPLPEAVLRGEPTEEQVAHFQIQRQPDIRIPIGTA